MIKKLQLLIIIFGALLVSCFKTDEVPPLKYDGKANMTIAELQKLHELSTAHPTTLIEDDIVITGVVTSTDEFGSSYKEIYIQDETGGICIRTSNTSFYKKYRIGQRVFVEVKGLCLGNYVNTNKTATGFYQLGLYGNTNGGVEFLSAKAENLHVFPHDAPEACPTPKVITKFSDLDIPRDYHTLVKLENCYFVEAQQGTTYFDFTSSYTTISRNIRFNVGGSNNIEARISLYCTFVSDTLPKGALNITGILTQFGNTTQLIICDVKDVEILPKEKVLKEFDMSTNPFSAENGWTNKQVIGDTKWQYNSSGNVIIQDPSGKTECWLVSPKLNFAGEKDIALFFNYRIRNAINDNIGLAYTVDGTNWNAIEEFTPVIGPITEGKVKLPDHVATNPNLQIAFQYKTTDNFPIWAITKITFKANVTM